MALGAPKQQFVIRDETVSITPTLSSISAFAFPTDKGDVMIPSFITTNADISKFVDTEKSSSHQIEGMRNLLNFSPLLLVRPLSTSHKTSAGFVKCEDTIDSGMGALTDADDYRKLNFTYTTDYESLPTSAETDPANVLPAMATTDYGVLMARNPGAWSHQKVGYTITNVSKSLTIGVSGSKRYAGTLPVEKLMPGSIVITANKAGPVTMTVTDDGNGNLIGDVCGTTDIIDYETGEFDFTFDATTITEVTITFKDYLFNLNVYMKVGSSDTLIEEHVNISGDEDAVDDMNRSIFITTRLEEDSNYVRFYKNSLADEDVPDSQATVLYLANGADGTPTINEIIAAYNTLKEENDIPFRYILTAGNAVSNAEDMVLLLTALINIAKEKVLPQIIADTPLTKNQTTITNFMTTVNNSINGVDGSYVQVLAAWQNWRHSVLGNRVYIAPSFYGASLYIQRDDLKQYPWYLPCGIRDDVGVLSNTLGNFMDLEDSALRDVLWAKHVNCFRSFRSQLYLDGDKNLYGKKSYFDSIGIRGLLNYTQYSLEYLGEYIKYMLIDLREDESIMRNKIFDLARPIFEVMAMPHAGEGPGIADYEIIADISNNPAAKVDDKIATITYRIQPNPGARYIRQELIVTKKASSVTEGVE